MLRIDGTFLPQTGEDFCPALAEEFSAGCDCNVRIDEPALLLVGDRLLVVICCP